MDEVLRRVKSAAENPADQGKFGADIAKAKDALNLIGVTASDNIKTMAAQFEKAWADQSLFSNKQNLGLLDQGAIQRSLQLQQQQATGKANIMELFGIQPDQVQIQALAAGQQIAAGLSQSMGTIDGKTTAANIIKNTAAAITPQSVAPLGAALGSGIVGSLAQTDSKEGQKGAADFGTQFIAAISASLTNSDAFATTGPAILQKIVDSWTTSGGIDLITAFANAFNVNLSTEDAIKALQDVGGKIFKVIFQGYDLAASGADYVAPIQSGVVISKKKTDATGQNASGTSSWRGGLTWVGERD
jgi:hypothetical protein